MSLDVDFTKDEIKQMIEAADTDKDGQISETEFIRVMTSAGNRGGSKKQDLM
jgi:Ca2+-binding EF-hand superfamily protein|tara:strand:+ start:181 stop:336 length:156 start_codon:yes stop_codon:yes gene_type:complete